MNIITEKTVFGGKSIAKIDGKTVFVPYSMPGEKLEINITESKRDYDNAEIVKIIEASEHRIEPVCKYYGKCGGCNMMHIEPSYQKELRKEMLKDIFQQNGIELNEIEVVSGPDYNYRCRFQLNDGGLSERNGNTIIPIENCECAEKSINKYLTETTFENRKKGRVHLFGSECVIKNGQNDGKVSISEQQVIDKSIKTNKTSKKLKLKENHYFAGTVASPENLVTVKIGNKELTFDVRGFFQSNLYVFEKVTKLITDSLFGGKNILDMYAGCGSISTFLTDKYENVVLVEHNRDAIVYAEQNLAGTKHTSYGLSGENWVKNCSMFGEKFDACVVDPPRSGMEKAVCDYLCKSKIPQICSLSCDPATHARDCARLIKAGYKLEKMYLLDFYPNTSHIESLALFTLNI